MPKFKSVIDLKKQQLFQFVSECFLPFLVKHLDPSIWHYQQKSDGVEIIYTTLADKNPAGKHYLIYYDPQAKKLYSDFEPSLFKKFIINESNKGDRHLIEELIDELSKYWELIDENRFDDKLEPIKQFSIDLNINHIQSYVEPYRKNFFKKSDINHLDHIDENNKDKASKINLNDANSCQARNENDTKNKSLKSVDINGIIKFEVGNYLPIPSYDKQQEALVTLQPLIQMLFDFVLKAKFRADAQQKKLYIPIGETHYSISINLCEIILIMICNAFDINKLHLECSNLEMSQYLLEVKKLISHVNGDDNEIKLLAVKRANDYLQSNNELFEEDELHRILAFYIDRSGNNLKISDKSTRFELLRQVFYWLEYEQLESQLRVVDSDMSLSCQKLVMYLALKKAPYMTMDISGFDSPLKQYLSKDESVAHGDLSQQIPSDKATLLLTLRETYMRKELKLHSQHVCSITGSLHLCGLFNNGDLTDCFHVVPISLNCERDDSKSSTEFVNLLYKDCYTSFSQQDKIVIEERLHEHDDLIEQGKIKSLDITPFKKALMILATDDKGRVNPEIYYQRVIPLVRQCFTLHQQHTKDMRLNNRSALFKNPQESECQTKSTAPTINTVSINSLSK